MNYSFPEGLGYSTLSAFSPYSPLSSNLSSSNLTRYEPNSVSVSGTQDANVSDTFDYDARKSDIFKNLNANKITNAEAVSQLSDLDALNNSQASGFSKFLKDPTMMSNITGLASTLLQAAALPAMLKNAKLQNKSLQFNLDTAKAEQARRNNNISAFNSFSA